MDVFAAAAIDVDGIAYDGIARLGQGHGDGRRWTEGNCVAGLGHEVMLHSEGGGSVRVLRDVEDGCRDCAFQIIGRGTKGGGLVDDSQIRRHGSTDRTAVPREIALAEGGQGHGHQRGDQCPELAETLRLHISSVRTNKVR